ncbi:ABC transporter permease [Dermatobacter hominis]|uniref:ABC transporter permease n=1 Tax=Dermatobacter hominis TaxID=2884263 RepID=UPI001D1045E9|nr:FtsX-like permease family protein [Dermatobacter hominis]UDY37096.1 FtsX-like permease family protein [Dermatobacter hominis]
MPAPLVRRELRARPGRVLMVFATVVVAVAFTTGAFGFSEQLSRLLAPSDSVQAANTLPEGTVVVTAETAGLATATALDDQLLDRIRAVDGVASAEGSYDQPVAFEVGWRGPVDRPQTLRGVVLSSTYQPQRWSIVEGRPPAGPDEVALDAGGLLVADQYVGGSGRLQLPTGTRDVTVTGLVAPAAGAPADGGTPAAATTPSAPVDGGSVNVALTDGHVILDPAVAPELLDAVGRVDRVTVIPTSGTGPDALRQRLTEALPESVRVDAITSAAAATQQTVGTIEDGVRTATIVYAGVTVLVAILVVVNVLSVILAQRTRELGLLRLVGARRRTVARIVVVEAVLIGTAASLVGGALGVVLAYAGARVVRVAGVDVDFAVTWAMVVVALAVGLLVTVIGSLWPALRASRVTPLDALSDTRAGADRPVRAPVPIACLAVGFGGAAWIASQAEGGLGGWTGAGIGLCLVVGFVGLALLSRWIVVPLAATVGAVLGRLSVPGRLGVGNARRQPSRTAGAASTLMVGLALVAVVATVGASARTTIDEQVRASGRADLYVERRGLVRVSMGALEQVLGLDPGFIEEVAAVQSFDGVVSGPGGASASAVASTLDVAARVADLGITAGDLGSGTGAVSGVMVSERTGEELGVGLGDTVTVRSTSGQQLELPVVATYRNTALFGGVIVDRDSAQLIDADGTFELAAIDLRDGIEGAWAVGGFQAVARSFNEVYVDTPESFARLRLTVADVALRVIGVMLVGALGVGFMGLAGTLALSTSERRRELVMLRAVGAKRRQIRALVWIEATFIGAVATIVGMGAGLVIGRVGSSVAPESIIEDPVVPWGQLGLVAVVGLGVAWLVSLGVARRASRLPPSEAGRL